MSRRGLPDELRALVDDAVRASGLEGPAAEELESELAAHFEDGLRTGLDAVELARRFGDPVRAGRQVSRAIREGREMRSREMEGRMTMSEVLGELRRTVRGLTRAPGWALLVVVTLALGVGANTAVFTVLDSVLLEPLPYEQPDRLVRVFERNVTTEDPAEGTSIFLRGMMARQHHTWSEVFESVAVFYTYREQGADLTDGDRPERIVVSGASAGFFETLGASPALGRTFREEESWEAGWDGPEGGSRTRLVVLSHGLWERRYGSDPDVIGRTVRLNGEAHQVVGVMDPDFEQPIGTPPDAWIPLNLTAGEDNSWGNFYLTEIARLPEGVSIDEARSRLDVLSARLATSEPEAADWVTEIEPLHEDLVGEGRTAMLWILAAAVGLVLLSACVNVANLVFARSLERDRDVALRGALGSGRARLVLHLVSESAVLAALGGLAGLVVGALGLRALLALAPDALPAVAAPELSGRVFLFAMAATAMALLLFGLAPALRAAGAAPARVLRGGGRSGTEGRGLRRLRSGLVVTQVALAMVLVVGAGLLTRSMTELLRVDLGVEPEGVFTFEVHLPDSRYGSGDERHAFAERLHARVAGLPGVESVGATSWLPVNARYHSWGLRRADQADPVWKGVDVRIIAGDYFRSIGIERLAGPAPADVDPAGEPVVWLNRTAAREVFGEDDAVGRTVLLNGERRVVGLVEDAAHTPRGAIAPQVFMLHAQYADDRNWALIHTVRTEGEPAALERAIATELEALDPSLVLYRPRTFESLLDGRRAQDRFATTLMGVFALLAVTLAGVGTYGVLSGLVARRRREIGIRLALGAEPGRVRGMVLRHAGWMVAVGLVVGLVGAWAASGLLGGFLFGIPATDPLAYAGGAAGLMLLGLAAGWIPAHRATRVDPMETLGTE